MDAEESQALFNYIVKKEYPLNLTKDEKCRLREKSGSFCVSNADLIHIGADNKRTRVIVANEEKNHLIETIHEDIGGGHFGQSATIRKISERFWWPGISVAVREYVWNCPRCQKANPSNKQPPATLHPIKVSRTRLPSLGNRLHRAFERNYSRQKVHFSGYRNLDFLEFIVVFAKKFQSLVILLIS